MIEAMERYGHLKLGSSIREKILLISAASIDRILKPIKKKQAVPERRNVYSGSYVKRLPLRHAMIGGCRAWVCSD